MTIIRDSISILTLLTYIVGIYLFRKYCKLAPVVYLNIAPSITSYSKLYFTVRYEIENKAKIRVYKPVIKIQVLEYSLTDTKCKKGDILLLSEWVPFKENSIKVNEQPNIWREPEIIHPDRKLYPGEKISIDRLYHVPNDNIAIHIGMQVEIKLGIIQKLIMAHCNPWSQTTTAFIVI